MAEILHRSSTPAANPPSGQSFDIIFEAPKTDAGPSKLTVLHNGILVHHALDTGGRSKEIGLSLQDHSNPVRYRNIWVRPIKGRLRYSTAFTPRRINSA